MSAQSPTPDPAIQATGEKLFKALADQDLDALKTMTVRKYAKKLTKDELRPVPTGPKLDVVYDGKVEVRRFSDHDAIVRAIFFKPQGSDVPVEQTQKLNIYLVKEKDGWFADAPDKKQAAPDATVAGGFFHNGAFTFCPNRGIEYLGGHFGVTPQCLATAICR
ncbi:MAG TPA: hypothetical protein VEJ86_08080 [Candidatus Binataceae bacterium]|nr:hypothetical protein [Candidatus Binataceae bacterium]